MKAIACSILTLLILGPLGWAFPTPVPVPKNSYKQACEIALEFHKAESVRGHFNTIFPQSVEYTNPEHSARLKNLLPKEQLEKDPHEWGWLITIVTFNDLSQSDTYFVRGEGTVLHLQSTE